MSRAKLTSLSFIFVYLPLMSFLGITGFTRHNFHTLWNIWKIFGKVMDQVQEACCVQE